MCSSTDRIQRYVLNYIHRSSLQVRLLGQSTITQVQSTTHAPEHNRYIFRFTGMCSLTGKIQRYVLIHIHRSSLQVRLLGQSTITQVQSTTHAPEHNRYIFRFTTDQGYFTGTASRYKTGTFHRYEVFNSVLELPFWNCNALSANIGVMAK